MSALGGDLDGLRVLDLFAGSGALGLEALSRGARDVVFVEKSEAALRVLRANVDLLGAQGRSRVVRADAHRFAERAPPEDFDVALADPPYGEGNAARLLDLFHRRPFARELWVEHRSDEPLPALPGLRHRPYGDTTLTTVESRGVP
jgi:16S rRNA (guanine966-N2)-methyltransferase